MRAKFPAHLSLLYFITKPLLATDKEASHYATLWLFICPFTGLDKPLEVQEFEASRISKQSAHEGEKVVGLIHRPLLPPRHIPISHFS
jgi:hypothetical protein